MENKKEKKLVYGWLLGFRDIYPAYSDLEPGPSTLEHINGVLGYETLKMKVRTLELLRSRE